MTDTNNGTDIVEKIRKMLRLARDAGATEAEAATAMAMAQRLMMQHNIDNVEEVVEQIAIAGDWHNYEIDKKWQQLLLMAIAKLYNCRSLMNRSGRVQFIGKASNVLVCADTLQWVTEQVSDLHKQALKAFRLDQLARNGEAPDLRQRKHESRDFRLSFKEACANRIYQRVVEIVAAARNEIPAHMALIVIDQSLAAADEIIAGMNVKAGRAMRLRNNGFGTGAGRAAGDQVKLQHTVKK
jgi:Protein of unknown function (DUF2786)